MPCKIVFLSGQYKGNPLNLGNGIVKSDQEQQQNRRSQEGHSLRTASNFVNVSPRTFRLSLEFYSPNEDVSYWVENCMTLQEIDPTTGNTPTLLYSEGAIQSIAPLTCTSIKVGKEHPFPGGKGFHYAKVDVSLELLGGKNSEHRFAKPLVDTELTKWRDSQTDAERARQGTIAVTQQALAPCLSPAENEQLTQLLSANKAGDVGVLSSLSSSALVQAAVAGLVPKQALAGMGEKLNDAISLEIAKKTSGVGKNAATLANAIKTGNAAGLPADLVSQVEQLQSDYAAIKTAIANQELSQQSPVFNRAGTSQTLIKIASCGLKMRQGGATEISKQQSNPPEWEEYFKTKLGDRASDQVARDQLVTSEINKTLADKNLKDSDIVQRFGLVSDEQAKKLRNFQPFKDKEDFVLRANSSGVVGRGIWSGFIDSQISSSNSSTMVS